MILHRDLNTDLLRKKIRNKEILLAGNLRMKIYGLLNCRSGKRMKDTNRVFFKSETEAILYGFRPCSHCMFLQYWEWKGNG
ncbi:MAG TPA: Ada metal-binding domain-containing protein [Cyclobacteriaceae bacterium]|nr:Ada metal-binding domain-containing protein [Cyclobacteriaceae bacterium]